MKIPLKKLIGALSLTIIFFSFQSVSVYAKDLTVITVEKENQESEYIISQDSVINAEDGIVIPKLIIEAGVEIVEINADIQILEVATLNNVELKGLGNIANIIISTDKQVSINTDGDIQRIEVTNKDARLVIKEGSKISELKLPEGSDAKDIITNFVQAKVRFENITGGQITPTPENDVLPTPVPEPTPDTELNIIGEKGNSSFSAVMKSAETSKVGTIPSNVSNIYVELFSDVDVDLEIWDEDNSIPILAYGNPASIQKDSATQVAWTYHGLEFVYSGWQGVNGEIGNEWIIIKGTTDRNYKVQVKNYGDDTLAKVNYSWGNEEEALTAIEKGQEIEENLSTVGETSSEIEQD